MYTVQYDRRVVAALKFNYRLIAQNKLDFFLNFDYFLLQRVIINSLQNFTSGRPLLVDRTVVSIL